MIDGVPKSECAVLEIDGTLSLTIDPKEYVNLDEDIQKHVISYDIRLLMSLARIMKEHIVIQRTQI